MKFQNKTRPNVASLFGMLFQLHYHVRLIPPSIGQHGGLPSFSPTDDVGDGALNFSLVRHGFGTLGSLRSHAGAFVGINQSH